MRKFRLEVAVMLIILTSGCAFAQRQGRADSVQNYSPQPPNPILNIHYQAAGTWSYIRLSDLLNMKRAVMSISDPKTNKKVTYEGVSMNQLVSDLSKYRIEVFQDTGVFHKDKLAVTGTDLDMASNMIVINTINGEKLGREHPFGFVTKNNRGSTIIVRNLSYIRLASIP
jgi:hypothetical protein